jgi:hypothetical protein
MKKKTFKKIEKRKKERGGWSHPMVSKEVALGVGRNHPQAKWGWLSNFFIFLPF